MSQKMESVWGDKNAYKVKGPQKYRNCQARAQPGYAEGQELQAGGDGDGGCLGIQGEGCLGKFLVGSAI